MSETTSHPTQQQQQDLDPNAMADQNNTLEEPSINKDTSKPKTSLEKYCDENPSASECLIYEE